ncbi:MAG TPA: carboxypeptidase-like regulatory domain-containing protein, partial [Gammaproteobacteria bacterium]|nr:carboxypeptidase-like regulatory domain-containing protein [Gammaproteobacteria bacterium]
MQTVGGARRVLGIISVSACIVLVLTASAAFDSARAQSSALAVGAEDIGGVVRSSNGPEAGVWVIAETHDLGTRFARIVVTDDAGRYLVPDLPNASYEVWVRGYGLVDSARVEARPGQRLDLTAIPTEDPAKAAEVYPAIYWYSMMKLPPADEVSSLPGGLDQYIATMKNLGCVGCHQLGQKATRTIPASLGKFEHGSDAWVRRIQSGQAGRDMIRIAGGQLHGIPFKYLGDWTDRVAAGELPHARPERPQGVERNVVATIRDWASDHVYLHDLVSTDRRNPTVNA